MIILTEFEKNIYNCYLKNSRKGQPYQPRKDFSDLDPNIIALLKKISYFLSKYPHIRLEDYFKAPNYLHPDDQYPKLNFFTSLAATKQYSLFKKQQEDEDPETQFDKIKDSFHFIAMFCLENKILLSEYANHKTGYMLSWCNHYREHRINPYSLMEIPNIFNVISNMPKDEVELFIKNLNEKLIGFKTRYMNSPKTKILVKEATKKIEDFLKKNLH
jgi:hypothetical protein